MDKFAKPLSDSGKYNMNYIVGIGASAGGLEALQKLLSALPADTGFPYIVVQHLSPDYKSLLGEILGKYTDMPVIQVEDGMRVEPDCVYVIQPGKNMRIQGGKLHLTAQRERELNLPIDLFFRSLAGEAGPKAIAVILSGTGSDGANGIKDVKENDGLILVQDPESAKFDGMPRSAMRTGLVDAMISPEGIALELQHIAEAVAREPQAAKLEKPLDDELMKRVYLILKKRCNVNFTHYKKTTIIRRIERRMMLTHKEDLQQYVDYLTEVPEEARILSKEVLIGVTSFFRDPEYFQCLKEKAVQDIVLHSAGESTIRVWVAGCSSGEEAYSIAILFSEVMDALKLKRNVKIFATDLDAEAIAVAGKGVYGDSIADAVSPARLSRYFTRKNNTYSVNREIRKMVVFSPHNVVQDPPFGKLDLISCRNLLIYFQPVLQEDLFAIFHAALRDGGYLFLGKSEAIGSYTEAFPVVDAAAKIFTHRSDVVIPSAKAVPYLQTTYLEDEPYPEAEAPRSRRTAPGEMNGPEAAAIDDSLLEAFMPACLVVNEKNEIVHTYGENANYVHFSLGKFSNGLYDVLTEGLKISVSTLLKEARATRQKVQYKNVRVIGERMEAEITLTAMPLSRRITDTEGLYALVFAESKMRGELDSAVPYEIDQAASRRITDLEQDLGDVQERLNRSVAEQECVNEELQAANEELLTANEELQSSNEELQSVNEELYTVNSEYQQKLSELADLNDDIANFLSTTLIGIIFVDNKLNIRRYTDYVTKEFSVMDHDIGRSLKFISYHFPAVDITEICENVLKTLMPDEREITTGKGKAFLMRVAPFRTVENKILGCVITLVDMTAQRREQLRLHNTEERLSIAQQISEAKSDYISRVAGEIRTPVSELGALAAKAREQIGNPEAQEPCLARISAMLEEMTGLVNDFYKASQREKAGDDSAEKAFSLRELMRLVQTMVAPRAKEAGLTFTITMAKDFDPRYVGSETALLQVLINFLNNAVKYNVPGGSVSLRAYEESAQGDVATLCFLIADTGIGIPEEKLRRLFLPHTNRELQDGEKGAGMGLGLTIAYNLIISMDGDVRVDSQVDRGSTFTVRVKLHRCGPEGERKPPEEKQAARQYALEGCHVLMAEDNRLNRIILGALLSHEGITYGEAADGEQAVKLYQESPAGTFDCILMDMRMPKLDGIRATAMIRDSGKEDAASIPIIGVSANGLDADIKQARLAGVNSYTVKPIDREKLLSVMSALIRRGNPYKNMDGKGSTKK